MRMKAPLTLLETGTVARLKTNYFKYINRAIADAKKWRPGTHGPFQTGRTPKIVKWFGYLDRNNKTVLVDGLEWIKKSCQNYTVQGNPRTNERIIQWCLTSGNELHSENTFASAFAYGVPDTKKHFTLRVYSGRLLKNCSYEWKANTLFHELSHRILATDDVKDNALCSHGDFGSECYGQANSKSLALNDSDKALKNASNWAFYINDCNGMDVDIP